MDRALAEPAGRRVRGRGRVVLDIERHTLRLMRALRIAVHRVARNHGRESGAEAVAEREAHVELVARGARPRDAVVAAERIHEVLAPQRRDHAAVVLVGVGVLRAQQIEVGARAVLARADLASRGGRSRGAHGRSVVRAPVDRESWECEGWLAREHELHGIVDRVENRERPRVPRGRGVTRAAPAGRRVQILCGSARAQQKGGGIFHVQAVALRVVRDPYRPAG